jgi:hypothetical protein
MTRDHDDDCPFDITINDTWPPLAPAEPQLWVPLTLDEHASAFAIRDEILTLCRRYEPRPCGKALMDALETFVFTRSTEADAEKTLEMLVRRLRGAP